MDYFAKVRELKASPVTYYIGVDRHLDLLLWVNLCKSQDGHIKIVDYGQGRPGTLSDQYWRKIYKKCQLATVLPTTYFYHQVITLNPQETLPLEQHLALHMAQQSQLLWHSLYVEYRQLATNTYECLAVDQNYCFSLQNELKASGLAWGMVSNSATTLSWYAGLTSTAPFWIFYGQQAAVEWVYVAHEQAPHLFGVNMDGFSQLRYQQTIADGAKTYWAGDPTGVLPVLAKAQIIAEPLAYPDWAEILTPEYMVAFALALQHLRHHVGS